MLTPLLHCITDSYDIMDGVGNLLPDVIKQQLGDDLSEDTVKELAEMCNSSIDIPTDKMLCVFTNLIIEKFLAL